MTTATATTPDQRGRDTSRRHFNALVAWLMQHRDQLSGRPFIFGIRLARCTPGDFPVRDGIRRTVHGFAPCPVPAGQIDASLFAAAADVAGVDWRPDPTRYASLIGGQFDRRILQLDQHGGRPPGRIFLIDSPDGLLYWIQPPGEAYALLPGVRDGRGRLAYCATPNPATYTPQGCFNDEPSETITE